MTRMPVLIRKGTGAVVVALLVAVLTIPVTAAQNSSLQLVRDTTDRFSIEVPSTWHVQKSTGDPALVAKAPAPSGQLPDSVDVIVRDMPTTLSPAACIKQADRVMRFAIHSWKIVSEGPTTIGGQPAYTRVYTWTSGGKPRRSVQACVTTGRRAYMIVATTQNSPAAESADMPLLMQIIQTLHVNPQAASPQPTGPVVRKSGKE